jgi:hypothetical protein
VTVLVVSSITETPTDKEVSNMPSPQRIEKMFMVDQVKGQAAELTLHYREGYEPSELVVGIEDVENGDVTFFLATGEENFDIVNNVTIVYLTAQNLSRVSNWFSKNSTSGMSLTTQKT